MSMTASATFAFCFSHDARPEPRELRVAVEAADVLLDQVDPRRRHVQRRVLGEAEREVLLALAVLGDRLHPRELGDAVGDVDDVVADLQVEERIDRPRGDDLLHAAALLVAVEQLVVAEQRERALALAHRDPSARRLVPHEPAVQIADRRRRASAQAPAAPCSTSSQNRFRSPSFSQKTVTSCVSRQLGQLRDRLLRLGLEPLERPDRQLRRAAPPARRRSSASSPCPGRTGSAPAA